VEGGQCGHDDRPSRQFDFKFPKSWNIFQKAKPTYLYQYFCDPGCTGPVASCIIASTELIIRKGKKERKKERKKEKTCWVDTVR